MIGRLSAVLVALITCGCMETQLVSAVATNAIQRYRLPELAGVDRVDVTAWKTTALPPRLYDARIPNEPVERPVSSSITDQSDVAELVKLVNDDRWWENPPITLAAQTAEGYHQRQVRPKIVFWSGEVVLREVYVESRFLTTSLRGNTIRREMSADEAKLVTGLIKSL